MFQHKLSSLVLFGALSKPQFKRTKMQYSSSMPKEFGKRRQKKKEIEGEEKEEEKSKDMHYNKDNWNIPWTHDSIVQLLPKEGWSFGYVCTQRPSISQASKCCSD